MGIRAGITEAEEAHYQAEEASGEARPVAAGFDGFSQLQQLRQRPLRADVPGLQLIQLLLCLDGRGDGHKAVQAAGIVTSVLVLSAAIHRSSEWFGKIPAFSFPHCRNRAIRRLSFMLP